MRVLHLVSSPTMTGPADPAVALAKVERGLLGYDSRIAFDRARPGNMAGKCEAAGVPVAPGLVLSTKRALLSALADRSALRSAFGEFDVIHAHTSHDHALAVLARPRGAAARLIRTIHHPRAARRRGGQSFAHLRTDGFVVIAEAHRQMLLAAHPRIDPARVSMIPGSVDCARFHPGLDGRAIRRALDLGEEAFVVAMVARIKPGRRHEVLVHAFERFSRAHAEARLVFIGKGEGEPDLRRRVVNAGLERLVRFAGFRDTDLPEATKCADVTVLLSEGNDASCRAVLESLALGVPVIGGRHPAITEALEGSECGWIVDPDDVDEVTHALEVMASAPTDQRATWRERARARAESRYSEARLGAEIGTFYEATRARSPVRP
jgi:L-malate glycosyltransferase